MESCARKLIHRMAIAQDLRERTSDGDNDDQPDGLAARVV
jgi:hypothetical protein